MKDMQPFAPGVAPVPPASRDRRRCLDLRGRIVLTNEGADFFTPRVETLHRYDAPDGEARYGFRLRTIDVPWLKRLLRARFVEKADFPVREVAAVKSGITDLSRLVVFSLLHGRFSAAALARSVETDVIRRWNRQHPHRALDARSAVSPPELRSAVAARTAAVEGLKRELSDPILRSLGSETRRSAEDVGRLSFFVGDLVGNLDPLVFFALLASGPGRRDALLAELRREISSCLSKVDLADYLALMVLELMGAAERATLVGQLGPGHSPQQVRTLLEDPLRRKAMISALPNGLSASMSWSLSRRWSHDRWQHRLRLGLHDGNSSYEDGRRLFEERGTLEVSDRSLQEFYEQGSGPYGDDGLGWYYFSFLADACGEMKIPFDASVRERRGRGTAAVSLSFSF